MIVIMIIETAYCCVAKAGLQLEAILLPELSECWDYNHESLCLDSLQH